MINKDFKIKYINEPYPIWVIDNFLNEKSLKRILKEWPDSSSGKWHSGHDYIDDEKNILEQGMISLDTTDTTKYISEVIEYIHSDTFTKQISDITKINDLIIDYSKRWSGLRVMKSGSFQAIHSDARINPETGFRKELTCLIYFNEDWKETDEGYFEAWGDDMDQCIHKIEPLNNRLVIFLNSDTSYHGVPKVNSERKSITWSLLKDGESENRSKALFVSRPQDNKKIGELGRKRAYIKDARRQ